MGLLDRFERSVDRAVNGAFAKTFKSEVQPVEIATALQREMDDRAAVVSRGRTVVPNAFTVELAESDYDRLSTYEQALASELAGMVREYAQEQGYSFLGAVEIEFSVDDELATGVFQLRSEARPSQYAPPTQPPPSAGPGIGGVAPAAPPLSPSTPVPPPVSAPVSAPGSAPGAAPGATPAQPSTAPQPVTPASASAGADLQPRIVASGGTFPLTKPVTLLGRGSDVDLRVDDSGVSRHHAEISLHPAPTIRDLNSTNGTFVDGVRAPEVPLRDGAVIQMGSTTMTFRVRA